MELDREMDRQILHEVVYLKQNASAIVGPLCLPHTNSGSTKEP